MIRFLCPRCRSIYTVEEDKARRKTTCPKCRQKLRVPSPIDNKTILAPLAPDPLTVGTDSISDPPSALPIASNPQQTPIGDDLIPCIKCRRMIAPEAAACPGCGAPNQWVEPEIARFLSRLWDFDHIPEFRAQGKGHVLVGTARKPRQFLDMAADAVGGLGFVGPFSMHGVMQMVAAGIGREFVAQELRKAAGRREEAFVVHVREGILSWQSTDDDFWIDVKEFFGFE